MGGRKGSCERFQACKWRHHRRDNKENFIRASVKNQEEKILLSLLNLGYEFGIQKKI
jgi:hypothetical protein